MCSESFLVEPDSIRFLLRHDTGLDLNKHFTHSIPYYPGNDRTNPTKHQQTESSSIDYLRCLVAECARRRVPLVVHNGFIDLVFLYQNFYAHLPDTLAKFVADLSEIFAAGIYDTKYISEFYARENASFLEYLYFRTYDYNNIQN